MLASACFLQVIWKMLFHLGRFSIFLSVIMAGFALSFTSLYSDCTGMLEENFGTFSASMLTLFDSMLGGAEFEAFMKASDDCYDYEGAFWIKEAGVFLLSMYLLIMSILLLNLLIAVLSTVHNEVSYQHLQGRGLVSGRTALSRRKFMKLGCIYEGLKCL